ncbi:hypothetical protein ACN47E_005554 [Coniothyrium glycines]
MSGHPLHVTDSEKRTTRIMQNNSETHHTIPLSKLNALLERADKERPVSRRNLPCKRRDQLPCRTRRTRRPSPAPPPSTA